MRLSEQGIILLKELEGVRLFPYDDRTSKTITSWNKWATVGVGNLLTQNEWNQLKFPLTDDQVDMLMTRDLVDYEKCVDRLCLDITQAQFDALTILCFNIGCKQFTNSSVVKILKGLDSSYDTLKDAWFAWNRDEGKVSEGLVNRRKREFRLFTTELYNF